MNDNDFLYKKIQKKVTKLLTRQEFQKLNKIFDQVSYINNNLRLNFRDYQKSAMNYGIYAIHHDYHNLMFNMATGCGKTDIMAGLILYMFNYYDIHDFLYTISKKAVVNQSKRALAEPGPNCLFHSQLKDKDGNTIIIRNCNSFPKFPQKNTIYICCISIQSLSSRIYAPHENEVSIDSATQNPLVILADEAHHYNADIHKKKNKAAKLDRSWERTLEIIRKNCLIHNGRPCYQFDFTATLNLNDLKIRNKYAPIMAYRYTLGDFMTEGYSKNIDVIHSTNNSTSKKKDVQDRMLVAILASQFRKFIARMDPSIHDLNFKPVLLFKSPTKKKSINNEQIFRRLINNLTINDLQGFITSKLNSLNQNDFNPVLTNIFEWWNHYINNVSIAKRQSFLNELQSDFGNRHNIINLNSKKDFDEGKWQDIDKLDQPNNLYRVIFEVKKVDEGWDVHSLFDIVRLDDKVSSMNYSLKEAQLIGRGARYYSFRTKDRSNTPGSQYKRCYDGASADFSNKRMLETLLYFTIDQPKYNKRLAEALKRTNTKYSTGNNQIELKARITKSFKKTNVYKHGLVYANIPKSRNKNNYNSLQDFNIRPDDPLFNIIDVHQTTSENYQDIDPRNPNTKVTWTYDKTFQFSDYKRLIKDIMPSITFYRYNTMHKYLPIASIDDFINRYLSGYHIRIRANYQIGINNILSAFNKVLTSIGKQIHDNFNKKVGSNIFIPRPVKDIINNYSRNVQINNSHQMTKQSILPKPMNINKNKLTKFHKIVGEMNAIHYALIPDRQLLEQHRWFTFDYEIGDGLERQFVSDMNGIISKIRQALYPKHIFLFRNDEAHGQLSLRDIPRKNHKHPYLNFYMPDFVLYISHTTDSYAMYEFYLEPKGTGFITNGKTLNEKDAWKQNLLEFIKPENIHINNNKYSNKEPYKEYLGSINSVSLYGIQFYEYRKSGTNWNEVRNEILTKLGIRK